MAAQKDVLSRGGVAFTTVTATPLRLVTVSANQDGSAWATLGGDHP